MTSTQPDLQIVDNPVDVELADSYLEYALAVIVSRAIPDARDGLKPVQRRLLYAMWEAGLRSDRPHRKSVSAVGDTMKKYHPHGDASIYDTLVRLAQHWVMSIPLVDGHGNMGSLDDGPAAARYTEARLTAAAESLIEGVNENTVPYIDNFDGSHPEPVVLPAAIPNLLVNGATGIAVGMATNIPPHNLAEVVNACIHLLNKPNAPIDELLIHVPAPDFPTGGLIIGDTTDTMRTGRGPIRVRARTHVEQLTPRRQGIVVTELPYNVGPEKVIARVRQLVEDHKLEGVSDVKDLSGRKVGTRLVFELRPGHDPAVVAEELFRLTPLEETFNVNMVALIGQKPVQCTLVDLCGSFIEHRLHVLIQATRHRLQQAEQYLHLLDGLIIAVSNLDEVIKVIRASKDTATARKALRKELSLSEKQAEHVLELPLRRLTALEMIRLRREHADTTVNSVNYRKLLADPKQQRQRVEHDLRNISATFAAPRRTGIVGVTGELRGGESSSGVLTVISDGNHIFACSQGSPHSSLTPHRVDVLPGAYIWAVTADGRCVAIPTVELPHMPFIVKEYVGDSTVVGLLPEGSAMTVVASAGTIKRVEGLNPVALIKAGVSGLSVFPAGCVVAGFDAPDESDIVVVATDGQLLRFPARTVRPQGRSAGGMAGMKLQPGASVLYATAVNSSAGNGVVVTVTDTGNVKTTRLEEFPCKGRNGQGMRSHMFKSTDTRLVASVAGDQLSLTLLGTKGDLSPVPEPTGRSVASEVRNATGVSIRLV